MAIPSSLGSNWLGLVFPVAVVIIGEFIGCIMFGVAAMKTNWKRVTGIAFAALGMGYTLLFAWCVLTTTYSDHVGLAERVRVLRNVVNTDADTEKVAVTSVRDDLGGKLNDLKQSCAKLDGANGILVKQAADQQGTINNCQTQALKLLTPTAQKTTGMSFEQIEGGVDEKGKALVKAIFVLITNKLVSPVDMTVSCDHPVSSIEVYPIPVISHGGSMARISDNQWEARVATAWNADAPLMANVLYYGENGVNSKAVCYFNLR